MFAYLKAVTVPTGVFAASEDWGTGGAVDAGLSSRITVAATELADLVAGGGGRAAKSSRAARVDEFADPVPFDELLAR
jgi:FMN reductase